MSLDVYLKGGLEPSGLDNSDVVLFSSNITHNLTNMAREVGIYAHLWRPEEIGIYYARDLIKPLTKGLSDLLLKPDECKQYSPSNGWGGYGGLVDFVERYLTACKEFPDATIDVSR